MNEFTTALATLATVFLFASLLALVNERLNERLVAPLMVRIGQKFWIAYVSILTGVALAAVFQIDLFTPLAVAIGADPLTQWGGIILTGLLIGGGSQLIHEVWPAS